MSDATSLRMQGRLAACPKGRQLPYGRRPLQPDTTVEDGSCRRPYIPQDFLTSWRPPAHSLPELCQNVGSRSSTPNRTVPSTKFTLHRIFPKNVSRHAIAGKKASAWRQAPRKNPSVLGSEDRPFRKTVRLDSSQTLPGLNWGPRPSSNTRIKVGKKW